MKVDVTQVLYRLDEPELPYLTVPARMVVGDTVVPNPESKPLTLRRALLVALNKEPDKEKLDFTKQMRRAHIARRIQKEDVCEFSAADIVLFNKVCAARYEPFLTAAVAFALEPDAKAPPEPKSGESED